jgi:hypothetical protein
MSRLVVAARGGQLGKIQVVDSVHTVADADNDADRQRQEQGQQKEDESYRTPQEVART